MLVNGKTLVRTRFAPSPTGYLHIGGARTALFNYLYAKRYGGSFILRIDDTDRMRNLGAAVKPILDGLSWLGIDWDEGPIYQSTRIKHYKDIAQGLILTGNAYPDPPNKDNDDKIPYRGLNRNMPSQTAAALYDDTGWAIRLRIDPGDLIVLDDLVRGEIVWNTKTIGDPVILRSDGTPTYNFASVVDDAEMKITHVIRAEEHLNNTPIQLMIGHALGYLPPFYAHVPFVCDQDSNKKLSKRDLLKYITPEVVAKLSEVGFTIDEIMNRDELNPVVLAYYQCLGYKPEAVANFLVRLGWSLDGTTELMNMKEMKKNFSLERISSGSAKFDQKKLMWMAGEYTKMEHIEVKTIRCMDFLRQAKIISTGDNATFHKVQNIVELCGDRIKIHSDILQYGSFFFRKPKYKEDEFTKHLGSEVTPLVEKLKGLFKDLQTWNTKSIGDLVSNFAETRGLKLNTMVFALRVAICGSMIGPSLFHSMEMIGKQECIERIEAALAFSYYLPMNFNEA